MKIKHKKIIFNLLLLVFGLTTQSQNTISTTGGDTSGSGGNSSFSIGQIVYSTITSTNGSVAQGVQQPFEISTVLGVDVPSINLELVVYPNPTANFLTLSFNNVTLLASNFQLFDMNGKIIESKKITNTSEIIKMENLPSAIYFLKITNNNKEIKTFKIIKN